MLGGLSPSLNVPTVVLEDGRPLAESNAILWYFADGSAYLPDDPYERAQVLQWLFFEQYKHEPAIAVVRFWVGFAADPPPAAAIEAKRSEGRAALDVMERHLADRRVLRRRALHDRRHRPLRLHPRGARGRLRPRVLPGGPRLARPRRGAAGDCPDGRLGKARAGPTASPI